MQNAKDSFYLALRGRLAVLNPARQITLSGLTRPGILVEENEAPVAQPPLDTFVLRWTGTSEDAMLPAAMETQQCSVFYATAGSDANERMDRGRSMTEMDAELAALLQPASTPKVSVGSTATAPMQTHVFWSSPSYGDVTRDGARLQRTVTVQVYSLQETLQGGGLER